MTMIILFCLIQLGFTYHTAGSSKYSVTGGSVTLEFKQDQEPLEQKGIEIIEWHFGPVRIIRYLRRRDTVEVFNHEGRVEFNKETFSLELKNLQKSDSGLYRGEIIAGRDVHVNYTLSVLDPVEAPVLSVVSNQSLGDFSNVTCRGGDLSLTSTCNDIISSPERKASTDFTLSLSVRDALVICNYSNAANFSTDTRQIKLLCPIYEGQNLTAVIVGSVVIAILTIAVFLVVWCRWRQVVSDKYSTEYGTVKDPKETPSGEDATHQGSLSIEPPNTTLYSLPHSHQPDSAGENLENCPAPESGTTVYSQVKKPSVAVCVVNPIYSKVEHTA
ncbi:uncharacterized protein LOC134063498 [Sardina pilchardus]|uniref:uncharacterized protein LOC134063498 n=1 Tax=Sardina pilchardus TaxID=27697 RepID=UPI002E1017A1